jgi:hypothetical protein
MNYMKGLEGCSFDQIITEVKQDGEYFTAHLVVTFGSYLAGKSQFFASATSRNQIKAIGYALEEIAKQVQKATRPAP